MNESYLYKYFFIGLIKYLQIPKLFASVIYFIDGGL